MISFIGTLAIACGAVCALLGLGAVGGDDRATPSQRNDGGVGGDSDGTPANSLGASSIAKRSDETAAANLNSGGQPSEWSHDFGVVPPGAVVSWGFPVRNSSDFTWTIDKVDVLCRCTVAGVSCPEIAPGAKETVSIELDCGEEVADIVKSAVVQFEEAGAPPVRLLFKASVRPAMTPSVREVSFGGLAPGDTVEQAIALENYSGAEWRDLSVERCPPWADVAIVPYRGPKRDPANSSAATAGGDAPVPTVPRQTWQAVVRFTGKDAGEGYHHGSVVLRADTGDRCEVYLAVHIEARVRVIPEKLVFGPARRGESCVRVARVIVQKRAGVTEIKARGAANCLSVATRRVNEQVWELKASLLVPGDGKLPDGEIAISFPATQLPDVTLPYSFFNASTIR